MTAQGARPAAGIVAIGSEMLGPLRQDTNSLWLSARLEEVGIPVIRKSIVGDDPVLIREELDQAARGTRYVFTTGGLGPTADDLTAEVVGAFQGREMVLDEALSERIAAIVAPLLKRWPNSWRRSASTSPRSRSWATARRTCARRSPSWPRRDST